MPDPFHQLYYLRRALQALAAYTGDDTFADIAAVLDVYAAMMWQGARG